MPSRFILILLLSLLAFLALLGYRDIVASHEARVAETAREMADSGWPWDAARVQTPQVALTNIDGVKRLSPVENAPSLQVNPWIVPTMAGQVRLQKPPLPYWCAAILFRLIGATAFAARLTPALLGVLSTFLLYDLARHLIGRRTAFYAALLYLSSFFIPSEYRKAMADPYLAFFTLLCLWAWTRACEASGRFALSWWGRHSCLPSLDERQVYSPARIQPYLPMPPEVSHAPRASAATKFILLFYLSLALGLLAKGPPLFVHIFIPIALYHICYRRPIPRNLLAHLCGLVIVALIALPWPILVLRQIPNAPEIWKYESIGELTENTENARPWWFYIPNLFPLALPWIGLWIIGIALPFLRRDSTAARRRRLLFPLLWYAAIVCFFSFVHLKKVAYLLPAMPAQTLLLAQAATWFIALLRRRPKHPALTAFIISQFAAGFAFSLYLAYELLFAKPHLPAAIAAPLTFIAISAALLPLRPMLPHHPSRWLITQSVAYIILLFLFFNMIGAIKENRRSPRGQFAGRVVTLASEPNSALCMERISPAALFNLPPHPNLDHPADTLYVLVEAGDSRKTTLDSGPFAYASPNRQILSIQKAAEAPTHSWLLYRLTLAPK